jgi:hypothetical protein
VVGQRHLLGPGKPLAVRVAGGSLGVTVYTGLAGPLEGWLAVDAKTRGWMLAHPSLAPALDASLGVALRL